MTYAIVKNWAGGYRIWLKKGRAKWYVDVNREGLTNAIERFKAQGFLEYR